MARYPSYWYGAVDGRPCPCGSGNEREGISDARGIFVAYVCNACRESKLSSYRHDIFTDGQYWADESIEPID